MSLAKVLINFLPFLIFILPTIFVFKFLKDKLYESSNPKEYMMFYYVGEIILTTSVLFTFLTIIWLFNSKDGWHPWDALKALIIFICRGCEAVVG